MQRLLISILISSSLLLLLSGCFTKILIRSIRTPKGPESNTVYRYNSIRINEDSMLMEVNLVASTIMHKKPTTYQVEVDLERALKCQQRFKGRCVRDGLSEVFIFEDTLSHDRELVIILNHRALQKDRDATDKLKHEEDSLSIDYVLQQRFPPRFYDDSFEKSEQQDTVPYGEISFVYQPKDSLLANQLDQIRVVVPPLHVNKRLPFAALVPFTLVFDIISFSYIWHAFEPRDVYEEYEEEYETLQNYPIDSADTLNTPRND